MVSIFLMLLFVNTTSGASTLTLSSDTDVATAGYYQLRWQSAKPQTGFVLQESTREDFGNPRTLYRGADLATVVSGKSDNTYYYRVIAEDPDGTSSNTVTVTVAHHPLRNAFAFFGVGAIVFLATLVLILRGHRESS